MAGIYKLTAPNGKCYIGQSIDLERRIKGYTAGVNKGQRHLHAAVKKYGWENFKVDILWSTKHPERYRNFNVLLDTLEIAWIKKFDSVANGLNLQYGGGNGIHSEETKRRMSQARAGKPLSKTHRLNLSRKVIQYDLNGKKIKSWETMSLAADGDNSKRSNINRACQGQRKTAGGFQWRYESDNLEEVNPILNYKKGKNNPKKRVAQYSLAGEHIKTWHGIAEAARAMGVTAPGISSVCRGKRITAGGFKWKYT